MSRPLPAPLRRRPVARLETVQRAGRRFRIGPWRGDPVTGYLAPLSRSTERDEEAVAQVLELLAGRGYRAVVTAAMAPAERAPYLALGFAVAEELHVLARPLRERTPDLVPLRRRRRVGPALTGRAGRAADRPMVLELDALAFDDFWRLDEVALAEARGATAATRYRVAAWDGQVVGYAVTGVQAATAYLQRLGVHPAHQGRGIGRALLGDACWWARRRHARSVLVNTQLTNRRALDLYRSAGFRLQPERLAVLRCGLDGATPDLPARRP